ncbi:hypothetical protein [Streptomyces toxytricini]|uniref:hypothetical protein n=1 Tax=Streptomyces toxytricini TaxID=67369 RepID=UPI003421CD46
MAALLAGAATACGHPLRDLGPLPPRYSGPPLAADTVVSELTAVLAQEGVAVEREQSGARGRCSERLSGRHAPESVNAALKAAFTRARTEHGWQDGPAVTGSGAMTLTKGNWTAVTAFPGEPAQGLPAPVIVSLTCTDGAAATVTPTAGPAAG